MGHISDISWQFRSCCPFRHSPKYVEITDGHSILCTFTACHVSSQFCLLVAAIFVHTAMYSMADRSLSPGRRDRRNLISSQRRPADVKHRFMHIYLHRNFWLEEQLFIDVNELKMVSINNGNWHGAAKYTQTKDGKWQWTILSNVDADIYRMTEVTFVRVKNSNTYLNVNSDPDYSQLLIEQPWSRWIQWLPLYRSMVVLSNRRWDLHHLNNV